MRVSRQSIALLVSIVLIVLGIAFASDYLVFQGTRPDYSDPVIYSKKNKLDAAAGTNGISETPAWMVPQAAPEMVPVSQVELADKEKVIAIEVDGQHFAYPLFTSTASVNTSSTIRSRENRSRSFTAARPGAHGFCQQTRRTSRCP